MPSITVAKKRSLAKPLPPYTEGLTRGPVLKALDFEHPIVTLEFGSLHKNIVDVLQDKPDVARSVEECLRAVVRRANDAKRQFQRVLGSYLSLVFSEEVQQVDRRFLNHLCENVGHQDASNTVNDTSSISDKKDHDILPSTTKQSSFIQAILVAMISGKIPPSGVARDFFARLKGLGLIDSDIPTTRYPASIIARSISCQLCVQLKKHFKYGTMSLHQKVCRLHMD